MQVNLIFHRHRSGKTHSTRIRIICYGLILVLSLSSCGFIYWNDVNIYLKNDMTDKNNIFNGIAAYIGGTKDASGNIHPGESDSMSLNPVAERVETLIFVYRVQEKKYQWEELKIEPKKKYTMEMIFNKPDQFQYRICQRPCSLKKVNWQQGNAESAE